MRVTYHVHWLGTPDLHSLLQQWGQVLRYGYRAESEAETSHWAKGSVESGQ